MKIACDDSVVVLHSTKQPIKCVIFSENFIIYTILESCRKWSVCPSHFSSLCVHHVTSNTIYMKLKSTKLEWLAEA